MDVWRGYADIVRGTPAQRLTRLERLLIKRPHLITKRLIARYADALNGHKEFGRFNGPNRNSMLHPHTLLLLRLFGLASQAQAVEIGPYVGGSSIAIASGLRERGGQPLISIEHGGRGVELGGIYSTHPQLPSRDIIADLKRNIVAAGFESSVEIIEGRSDDPRVVSTLRHRVQGTIDLVVIDADGEVARDLAMLKPWLAPGCLLVIDDYAAPGNPQKQELIRQFIDGQVACGTLEPLTISGWGTWFGRLPLTRGARTLDMLGSLATWLAARALEKPRRSARV